MPPISITVDAPTNAEIAALLAAATGLADAANQTSANGGPTSPVTSPSTGGSTTPTTSGNVYPLAMPAGVAAGAPVTLGTGPNSIVIYASNNPGSGIVNQFVVVGNFGSTQTALAGPLTCSSNVGMSQAGSQVFTINGDFSGLTSVGIVAAGSGISGLWINELTVNLIPWQTNTDAINSRGTGTPSYGTAAFNSNGANETWLPASAIPAASTLPSAATQSTITGATIGGTAQAPGTLATLIAGTAAGATLTLPAGTFVGTSTVPNACTITGAGMGKTIIDCTGMTPTYSKAILVPLVAGSTISNLTLQNASIAASQGNNAAGVRDNGAGIGFTLDTVEVTGCQDGLLTFASTITLSNGHTHDNGAGDGLTHEIYLGGDVPNTCSLINWTSTCGLKSTHALKTRAGTTNVSGGTFTGSPDTTGNVGGSVIDVPDGGNFTATGATIVLAAGAANHNFLTYGAESATNAGIGSTVTLTNVVFTDNTGSGGIVSNGTYIPAAKLVLNGCTYTGATPPSITGFASVTGTITKATVPPVSAA